MRKRRLLWVCLGLAAITVMLSPAAFATPGFARKYEMSCNTCHTAWPNLNEFGREFWTNGFRLESGHTAADNMLQLDEETWLEKLSILSGKINGREPVYMNIGDAAARGISTGDTVAVFNGRGRCLAAAVPTEDVMPRVARMATGAWYDPDEASGIERHGNPNAVTLDRAASGLSQGCAAQTCLVEIERVEEDAQSPCAHRLPIFTHS